MAVAAVLLLIPSAAMTLHPEVVSSSHGDREFASTTVTPRLSLTIRPGFSPLNISTPTGTPNPVDVNATLFLLTNVTGGVSPYQISWSGLPSGCASANTTNISCTPSKAGSYLVLASVNDSNGSSARSASAAVTVNSAFEGSGGVSPDAGPKPLNVSFFSFPFGGTSPYSFHWLFGDGTGSYQGNVTHDYAMAGVYTAYYWQNDSGGGSFVWNTSITVVPKALSVDLASRQSVDLGQSVQFSANVSGGTGNYSIGWSGLPTPCVPANSSRLSSCVPSIPGTYPVAIYVHDTVHELANSQFSFTVYAPPTVAWLRATLYTVDVNQMTVLNVAPTNGTGVFNFTWNGLPAGCRQGNLSFIDCTPTSAGVYPVNVTLVDSNGLSVGSPTIVIHVDPALALTSVEISTNVTEVGGRSIAISSSAGGGSGPYTFRWSGFPPGCSPANSSVISCSPDQPGNYSPTLSVSDSNGEIQTASSPSIRVFAQLGATPLRVAPATVTIGNTTWIAVRYVGGDPPVTAIYSGLPTGCTGQQTDNWSCTPTTTGTFEVRVNLRDALGEQTNESAALNVVKETHAPENSTPAANDFIAILIGTVIVGAAVVGFAVVYIKRNRSHD